MEWVSGAAMLVPRAVVDDVGLMNEAYFMFNEEVDWQWRMRQRGWRVRFEPAAQVEHLGGGSTAQAWGAMYESQVTSHVRYLATNVGVRAARRARLVIASALLVRAVLWKGASLVPGGDRARRAARAATFARGWRAVRRARVRDMATSTIPPWHMAHMERTDPASR
jgi:GT2 family glycosyltransferase